MFCFTQKTSDEMRISDWSSDLCSSDLDNSAMDGFALRHADLAAGADSVLHLVGEQFAGHSLGLDIGPGQCLRITTGAPLPAGADAIAIKENVRVDEIGRASVGKEC